MNKLFILFVCILSALLVSCSSKSNPKNEESELDDISEKEMSKIDVTSSDIQSQTTDIYAETDSEDWDELLESYEEYVDKYISYLKKASKGDMDALSEYPALLEKAQEFSDKMANAQSSMSASQWAKYNKITMKMLKAAQEMN